MIIYLDPKPFLALMNISKVNIGWERLRVREYLRPLHCYKCQMYGHLAKCCKNQNRCSNCGSHDHKHTECKERVKCVNYHNYNERFKTDFDVKHNARHKQCKILEKVLEN